MSEKEPELPPEVGAALQSYEEAMRYGTERDQKEAFRRLQAVRQRLGSAALSAAHDNADLTDESEAHRAAS